MTRNLVAELKAAKAERKAAYLADSKSDAFFKADAKVAALEREVAADKARGTYAAD